MQRRWRQMLETLRNRLPARAVLRNDGLYLALRDIGPEQLRDAFMQETIARIPAAESFVQIAREDLGKATPETAPAGLVFHVARCGSTLISQLLKTHDNLVVYAEPLPFNETPAAAAQEVASRTGRCPAVAWRRLCPSCRQALRPEIQQLEYAVLRPPGGGVSGLAVDPQPARSRRGRRVAAGSAGGVDAR